MTFVHQRALVEAHFSSLMEDTYDAFGWPAFCTVFVPGPQGAPPEAKIFDIKPRKALSLPDWQAKFEPKSRPIQALPQKYANYLWLEHGEGLQNIDEPNELSSSNATRNSALDIESSQAGKRRANASKDHRQVKIRKIAVNLPQEGDKLPYKVAHGDVVLTIYDIRDGIYLVEEVNNGGFENHHKNKTLVRFLAANRLGTRTLAHPTT